jgi:hypothetical protein
MARKGLIFRFVVLFGIACLLLMSNLCLADNAHSTDRKDLMEVPDAAKAAAMLEGMQVRVIYFLWFFYF